MRYRQAKLGTLLCGVLAVAAAPAAPLSPSWVYPARGVIGPVASSPTVYHDVVYAGSDDGCLYAIHAVGDRAGTLLEGFPIRLDGAVKGRPAVYGAPGQERVYVATVKGSLYAFTLDGRAAWERNPQSVSPGVPIVSTPAVRGAYVYVTAANGRIVRRHMWDGSPAGGLSYGRSVSTSLPRRQAAPPAQTYLEVADASAFFAAGRITVLGADPVGDPVSYDYTYSGKNTAVRPNRLLNVAPVGSGGPVLAHPKGSVVLGLGPGARCTTSPTVPGSADADLVIAALDAGQASPRLRGARRNLVAVKSTPSGLVPQWEAAYGGLITTDPLMDERNGSLYVGTWNDAANPAAGGRVYRLQASNGQADATWGSGGFLTTTGGAPAASPWFDRAHGVLYFGTTDGALQGCSADTGAVTLAPNRLDNLAGSFLATPLAVGNRLYIGSQSGRFYSVPVASPSSFDLYQEPDGAALSSSPSASGAVPGRDVVVLGSSAGRIIAFPVTP